MRLYVCVFHTEKLLRTLYCKIFCNVNVFIDPVPERIDYDKVREIALECKPQLIVCGASAYPREIDYKRFREIADEVGAYLMADIAPP